MPPGVAKATYLWVAIIHLVRHARHADYGQVLSGRSDIRLAPEGEREADRLAGWLARRGLTHLQASPRPRARQTAEAIGRACGLPVEIAPALEEIDFGSWTGRSFAELGPDPDWQFWNAQRSQARPPGGESQAEAVARADAHIQALAVAHPDAVVALVTHADVIRGLVAHHLGLGVDGLLRFDADAASVSTLVVEQGAVRISGLNVKGWE